MGWLGVHSSEMGDRSMSVIPILHMVGTNKMGGERGLCDTEEVQRAQRVEKGNQGFGSSLFSKLLLIKA